MKTMFAMIGIVVLLPVAVLGVDFHYTIWRTDKMLLETIHNVESASGNGMVSKLRPTLPKAVRTKDRKIAFVFKNADEERKWRDANDCSRVLKTMIELIRQRCYTKPDSFDNLALLTRQVLFGDFSTGAAPDDARP